MVAEREGTMGWALSTRSGQTSETVWSRVETWDKSIDHETFFLGNRSLRNSGPICYTPTPAYRTLMREQRREALSTAYSQGNLIAL